MLPGWLGASTLCHLQLLGAESWASCALASGLCHLKCRFWKQALPPHMGEGLVGEDLSRPLAWQAWSKLGSLVAAFGVGILRAPPENKDGGEHSPLPGLGASLSRRNRGGI